MQNNNRTKHRIVIFQRVVPSYRYDFFKRLANEPDIELKVLAGLPSIEEGIKVNPSMGEEVELVPSSIYNTPLGSFIVHQGIMQWLKRVNPHMIIAEANPRLYGSWICQRWGRRAGTPVVGWGLGSLDRHPPSILTIVTKLISGHFVRRFNSMIAYSSKAKQDYVNMGVEPNHVSVAFNSIDTSLANKWRDLDSEYLARQRRLLLGERAAGFIVVYIGRLIKEKKVDLMIRALLHLRSDASLIIIGDGRERENLEHMARNLGVKPIFTGHLEGDSLGALLSLADLCVLPGLGGLSIVQAMSFGVPVILRRADGSEIDLVRPGVTGAYFSGEEPSRLAEAIDDVLKDRAKLNLMKREAKLLVEREFSLGRMVDAFLESIAKTISRKPK